MKIQEVTADGISGPSSLTRATSDGGRQSKVRVDVAAIINGVKAGGDEALLEYTRNFDGVTLSTGELRVTGEEIDEAMEQVDDEIIDALEVARANIEKFHERQLPGEWELETTAGIFTGMLIRPLSCVGIYVPGGKAFYPSTVLMCAVPAKVAGVEKVIMVTPPRKDKKIEPIVLVAARVAGVDEIYRIGGAQAIAALAFGTKAIPRVEKVVGPGNVYVSTAKQLLQGEILIDSPAGPSEVLIVASESASVENIALDMCAQAEHDEDAISMALVPSPSFAQAVVDATGNLAETLERREIIVSSLEKNGMILFTSKAATRTDFLGIAASVINAIAPEHLELFLEESDVGIILPRIKNAGAVFIGESSPVSLGDYASGTNHVLPTNGTATRYSALNTTEFLKYIPFTRSTRAGLENLGPTVSKLARLEGLEAHARTIDDRKKGHQA
ncbi:MAG: histidinol dehydrogenase [Promethearchaeota archaeon]